MLITGLSDRLHCTECGWFGMRGQCRLWVRKQRYRVVGRGRWVPVGDPALVCPDCYGACAEEGR